jgi:peptidoglycan/LPS O-acetylase OafA/YrhL
MSDMMFPHSIYSASAPPNALSPPATDTYRPDIDGLRALAVALVVLYHAFPKGIPGGDVGVDIFFVISGFLISSILFKEIAENRFSITAFYGRRIRRIFPALALCLAAVLAYGFVSLMPSELMQLGKHVFFGASFLSNIALWSESGYFDIAATLKPLLHLWSLGVEEQFYIFWPVLIWLASRLKARMVPLLAGLFLASFMINIALSVTNIADDFYLPLPRFWELIVGAGLACWRGGSILSPRSSSIISFAGLAVLLVSAQFFSPEMRFPGWAALLPVVGAAALIFAGPDAFVNRVVLSHRAVVFVGLISYPLYIWHWPLISYAYILRLGKAPTPLAAGGLVVVSVLLAWATYHFVERPVRFGMHRHGSTLIAAVCVALLGACGLAVWSNDGFPGRYPPLAGVDMQKISAASVDDIFKPTRGMDVEDHNKTLIAHLGSGVRKIALSGDSLLFHYGPRIQELSDEGRLTANVYFVTGASCAPVPGIIQRDNFAHCANMPDLLADLVAREKVQSVLLGASWGGYGGEMLIDREGRRLSLATPEGKDAFYANLGDFVRSLQGRGAKVYLVLGVPNHARFNPHEMVTRSLTSFHLAPDIQALEPTANLRAAQIATDSQLREVAAQTGATLLDPVPDICGDGEGCSPFFDAGEPKYSDNMHLRPIFVRKHLRFLDALLTGPAPPE